MNFRLCLSRGRGKAGGLDTKVRPEQRVSAAG